MEKYWGIVESDDVLRRILSLTLGFSLAETAVYKDLPIVLADAVAKAPTEERQLLIHLRPQPLTEDYYVTLHEQLCQIKNANCKVTILFDANELGSFLKKQRLSQARIEPISWVWTQIQKQN